MNCKCYLFRSFKGDVTITENEEHRSLWDLRIGGKLIRPKYKSPEEAADFASRRDFGDEELEQIYVGLRVPGELDRWEICDLAKMEI